MTSSNYRALALAALLTVSAIVRTAGAEDTWTPLFNGRDLTGWQTFIEPEAVAKGAKPEDIWQVTDGVIHCAGRPIGYLLTDDEYSDYVLRFKWKWGEKPGNSGCFVHVVGEDLIWPKGVEAQLQAGAAGDFWLVGGAQLDIDKSRQDPKVERHYFRSKKDGVEKPIGEWNEYEITCDGDTIKLVINGQEVNVGTNSELKRGRILLQSEGAEIFFKDIELRPLGKK